MEEGAFLEQDTQEQATGKVRQSPRETYGSVAMAAVAGQAKAFRISKFARLMLGIFGSGVADRRLMYRQFQFEVFFNNGRGGRRTGLRGKALLGYVVMVNIVKNPVVTLLGVPLLALAWIYLVIKFAIG